MADILALIRDPKITLDQFKAAVGDRDPNVIDPKTETNKSLEHAIAYNKLDFVKYLIEKGADVKKLEYVNKTDATSYFLVCLELNRSLEYYKVLLDAGLSPDAPATPDRTTLMKAAEKDNKELFDLFLERGANINHQVRSGLTPLFSAVRTKNNYYFTELIKRGADVNKGIDEYEKNETLLMRVVYYASIETEPDEEMYWDVIPPDITISRIRVLLEKGADTTAKTTDGETAADIAIKRYDLDYADMYDEIIKMIGSPEDKSRIEGLNRFKQFQKFNVYTKINKFDKRVLQSYTQFGDRIINQVLRGNVSDSPERNPVFIENVRNFMKEYSFVEDSKVGLVRSYFTLFMNTFRKTVPVLESQLTVYRGIRRQQDLSFHGNEFLSTSLSKNVAKRFQSSICCFITIHLQPGIRALWIEPTSFYPEEKEVLIAPPFQIIKNVKIDENTFEITIGPKSYTRGATRRRKTNKRNNTRKT